MEAAGKRLAELTGAEWGMVSPATAEALNEVRWKGGRIVAAGTTSLRLLESAADRSGMIRPFAGETSIFITPGHRFRAVDLLMTNFHLPRSTLFCTMPPPPSRPPSTPWPKARPAAA